MPWETKPKAKRKPLTEQERRAKNADFRAALASEIQRTEAEVS